MWLDVAVLIDIIQLHFFVLQAIWPNKMAFIFAVFTFLLMGGTLNNGRF
ncbi:hypothetical protein OU5_1303 [Pseudomonas mandelii JR-1]|uniref:Uncharacterized protein n=1 Tax=Pseudomonas mandelii JR-1 TaxID=1147786 RepID=A0A024E6F3_9PSED|nr:hypothetical protein OU5_1303 [Pseudomonas mandelii JR-1]